MFPAVPASAFPFAILIRSMFLRALTGLVVSLPPQEVRARILGLSLLDQASLIGGSVVALFLASSLFLTAGPVAPVALWITLLLVVR